ncbi:MAG TPA: PH domain-containing protein [Acidimicrobiia bacterium]|nr:PH domain-containing protein [Acidimicrobiia bacterium]
MTSYRAPYDNVVRGVTVFAGGILLGVALLLFGIAIAVDVAFIRLLFVVLAIGVLAIVVLSYLWAPKSYRIAPGEVVVERPAGALRFALDAPVDAWRTDRFRRSIRTGGNGGLFGAYGLFRNGDLGSFRTYARRSRDYVVVRTASQTVVFGPDDPDRFADEVRRAATRA